jgi:uncharacterized tellurite resistance protein B-like protein
MNFKEVLTRLYFILICSDGNVNEKEVSFGRKMVEAEGIDEQYFFSQIKLLEVNNQHELLPAAIESLKKLTRDEQLKCIAWLCIIANADGFMDKAEWQMIYKVYHKELQLPLDEVMKIQKNLSKNLYKAAPSGVGNIIPSLILA